VYGYPVCSSQHADCRRHGALAGSRHDCDIPVSVEHPAVAATRHPSTEHGQCATRLIQRPVVWQQPGLDHSDVVTCSRHNGQLRCRVAVFFQNSTRSGSEECLPTNCCVYAAIVRRQPHQAACQAQTQWNDRATVRHHGRRDLGRGSEAERVGLGCSQIRGTR